MDNANCSTLSEVIVMECATCYMLPCYVPDYSSSFTRRSLRNERSGAILTLQRRSRTVRSDSRHGWRRNNVCMFSSRGLAARIVARVFLFSTLLALLPSPPVPRTPVYSFLTHPLSTNSTHIHLIACATTLDDVYDHHPATLLAAISTPPSRRCYSPETHTRVPATPQHPFLLLVQSRPRPPITRRTDARASV